MRIIIRTVPDPKRQPFVAYLKRHLPQAEWCVDQRYHDPSLINRLKSTYNFLDALKMAGDGPCLHMEDDVILTKNFVAKAQAVIEEHPGVLVQFFSMRPTDLKLGSRWDRKFMMNQCFYLPAGYSKLIEEYYWRWPLLHDSNHLGGYDEMMQDWPKERREDYWLHVPSLVDHRVAPSIANPKRSPKRQSLTFQDPVEGSYAISGYAK